MKVDGGIRSTISHFAWEVPKTGYLGVRLAKRQRQHMVITFLLKAKAQRQDKSQADQQHAFLHLEWQFRSLGLQKM